MSTMKTAIKAAGLSIPLNKRVWLWLHDHPGKTGNDIALALNETKASVSSILGAMQKRQMVSGAKEFKIDSRMQVTRYSTIGKLFALKPLPKKVVAEPEVIPEAPPAAPKSLLDTLTAREAFELYKELRGMFGDKA